VSPLEDDFIGQAEKLTDQMNRLGGDLSLKRVGSLANLTEHIADTAEALA
jgi:hypothetical protein